MAVTEKLQSMGVQDTEMKVGVDKPSNHLVYWTSLGFIGLSLALYLGRKYQSANFIGLWVPSLLGLGIYLKENKVLDLQKKMIQQQPNVSSLGMS